VASALKLLVKVDGSIQEEELAKNVPYSVAIKHQQLLCGYLQSSFFTHDDLESGPCKAIAIPSYMYMQFFLHDIRSILLLL